MSDVSPYSGRENNGVLIAFRESDKYTLLTSKTQTWLSLIRLALFGDCPLKSPGGILEIQASIFDCVKLLLDAQDYPSWWSIRGHTFLLRNSELAKKYLFTQKGMEVSWPCMRFQRKALRRFSWFIVSTEFKLTTQFSREALQKGSD